MHVLTRPPRHTKIHIQSKDIVRQFRINVVTLIGNIFSCGLILAFLIGVIYGIRFMLQIKQQDKEEYERKKAKDELERKEAELRYQKMLEDRR